MEIRRRNRVIVIDIDISLTKPAKVDKLISKRNETLRVQRAPSVEPFFILAIASRQTDCQQREDLLHSDREKKNNCGDNFSGILSLTSRAFVQ